MAQAVLTGPQSDDPDYNGPGPLIGGTQNLASIGRIISSPTTGERPAPQVWYLGVAVSFLVLLVMMYAIAYLLILGTGIWGINVPVAWGFAIINFVWWIGIGHAGTLISAILLLLHQKWRTSINRFAEAMTIFAVMCAGIFPLIHMGRPWYAYWLLPYPNTMAMWPNFRSPLVWDVFAVSTYFTVSLVFWYVGMIPDFGSLRDHAPHKWQRYVYGMLAMGWRGSTKHWRRYEKLYLILAGLATPLVLSVHTVVSFDFAVALVPLWHATIFPPFFVAGAIYSGFAMVLVLALPLRKLYGLEDLITERHIDFCSRVMLATGLLVTYGYFSEVWMAWYGHGLYEWGTTMQRLFGPYGWSYWALITTNSIIPQVLWSQRMRRNHWVVFFISVVVLIGMWFERFVIVITLARDYVPGAWGNYSPTIWDWATFIGTMGMFFFLFLLFCRFLPMISMAEMRELLPRSGGGRAGHSVSEGPP